MMRANRTDHTAQASPRWLRACVALGASMALGGSITGSEVAAADDSLAFSDLFLDLSVLPKAKITERATDSNTTNTTYRWNGIDRQGLGAAVASLSGWAHSWGGIIYGAELAYSRNNISPTGYSVSGTSYEAGPAPSLSYQSLGVNLDLGYEYGIGDADGISAFLEVVPWVGAGGTWAESDDRLNPASESYRKASGHGTYYEFGMRVGGFLTERQAIYGLSFGYSYSRSVVPIEPSNEFHTDLTIERGGFSAIASAGYRF